MYWTNVINVLFFGEILPLGDQRKVLQILQRIFLEKTTQNHHFLGENKSTLLFIYPIAKLG
jgi:hypothetical protein